MAEKAPEKLQSPLPALPQVVLPKDQSVAMLPATARLTSVAPSQKLGNKVLETLLPEPPSWMTLDELAAQTTMQYSKAQRIARIEGGANRRKGHKHKKKN